MGGEIAQVITYSGLPVVLKDIDQSQLDLARRKVEGIYQRRVDKGKMTTGQVQEKLDLIDYTLEYDDFADVDIVVEAVVERLPVKQQVFREVEEVAPGAVLATNTSTIPVGQLAVELQWPERFCGLHFFHPVGERPLVEIVRGAKTATRAPPQTET